ncbi:MAG: GtrA family protein [Bacteroides sp.]|nr:GtrA family protein [Eubacterium sp.]MCM1418311.1 GtrA family protein [Roseburia sp.]MCM1462414.1 GtrA family protein [Bacteroides sp.]
MKKEDLKSRQLPFEFIRYAFVGGISFLADAGTLALFREFIFPGETSEGLYFSTAIGFIVGLIVNYLLSIFYAFRKSENRNSGRDLRSFLIFAAVGVVGLGLTELGMFVGTALLQFHYLFTRIVVAALVLIWNYIGRKIFVFERK